MDKNIVSVTSEGRLILPAKITKELKIGKGTKLIVSREKTNILLQPMTALSEIYGIDKEIWKGSNVKKEISELRKEWDKEFRERVEP